MKQRATTRPVDKTQIADVATAVFSSRSHCCNLLPRRMAYYGMRYYSPGLGRWLSRDPMEEEGGLLIYAFACNDPVVMCDAIGTFSAGTWYAGLDGWRPYTSWSDRTMAGQAATYFRRVGRPFSAKLAQRAITETAATIGDYELTSDEWGLVKQHPDFKNSFEAYVKAGTSNYRSGFHVFTYASPDYRPFWLSSGDLQTAIGHVDFDAQGGVCCLEGMCIGLFHIKYIKDKWDFSAADSDWRVRVWGRLYDHGWIPKYNTFGDTWYLYTHPSLSP